jgi:acyl-coenzyme A thioesterase PaaI-like protein
LGLSHHELCFGCGSANLFGLQMELEEAGDGSVAGRFFLKQDHQGPGGTAHAGVMASALEEAMALALHVRGVHARARELSVELLHDAPVGTFIAVEARFVDSDEALGAVATLSEGERVVARARGSFALIG